MQFDGKVRLYQAGEVSMGSSAAESFLEGQECRDSLEELDV